MGEKKVSSCSLLQNTIYSQKKRKLRSLYFNFILQDLSLLLADKSHYPCSSEAIHMRAQISHHLPNTVSVAFADKPPAVFCAIQLQIPMSSIFTFAIKNTSSSGMTCILLSLAAGKSVPPSFCQEIWGVGWPSAAHSSRAIAPVRMVRSMGVFRKEGSSGSKETWFQYFQYQEKSSKSSTAWRIAENKRV